MKYIPLLLLVAFLAYSAGFVHGESNGIHWASEHVYGHYK